MKILDEKGRLFGVINIIDLAVVALLLLVIGVLGYKTVGSKLNIAPNAGTKELIVTVECLSRPEAVAKAFKKGDQLLSLTNTVNAYIESVSYKPAIEEVKKEDGSYIIATKPISKDILITIKMTVDAGSAITKLGSQDIAIAKQFVVKTKNADVPGIIRDVVEK
ncbi:MAG: DUF4330 domain-containing protein [Clostridia bacterium]|nr:DUF4330 domain-containing protein [Clostridia bacterium]